MSAKGSESYALHAARCEVEGGVPIETRRGYLCGFHKPMDCGNQGTPLEHKGRINFTVYPCNAAPASYQQPAKTAHAAASGLELKLSPNNA